MYNIFFKKEDGNISRDKKEIKKSLDSKLAGFSISNSFDFVTFPYLITTILE